MGGGAAWGVGPLSLAGQVWPARLLLPAFLLFLGLPLFVPIFPLHSPSTRVTTNTNGVSSSTITATLTSLPDANPSKLQYSKSGVVPRHQPTCLPNKRGNASGIGPTGGDQRHWRLKKNDRERSTLLTGKSLRVQSFLVVDSRQNLDANQSRYSCIRSCRRIPRIECACTSGISGYIKRVEKRTEPFRLGLAKV